VRPLTWAAALLLALAAVPAAAVTLEEAIDAALSDNPAAVRADANRDAASAGVDAARGASLPTARFAGSVGTGWLDPKGYFGLQAADVTPATAAIAVEQPLWAGGRLAALRVAASAGSTAAEAMLAATRAQISAEVADTYAGLLVARREIALRRAQLAQMREIARTADLRFRAGETAATEPAQARARLAEAEALLMGSEATEAGLAARFAALTGLEPDDLAPLPPPPDVPAGTDAAVAQALSANPRLAAATASVRAAEADLRAARAERLPQLGAYAEASTVRDQFFPDYVADQWSVGVRARWTLFDASRGGRIAAASAGARAADAAREESLRMLKAETAAAYAAHIAARRMVTAAHQREAAAAEALRATRLEVKVGQKPQLALLDAERESVDAAVAALRAEAAVVASAWRLKALTAG
jgi:outer membrane protein